jgi:hypothetical protein
MLAVLADGPNLCVSHGKGRERERHDETLHCRTSTVHRPGDDPRKECEEWVMFVTIQRENILLSKITDYWLTNAHELLTTEWLKY